MNIKQLKDLLALSYTIRRPALSLSSPGVGKSSSVYQAVSSLSAKYGTTMGVIEVRAATTNPAELADIKFVVDGTVREAFQGWFPDDAKVARGEVPERGIIYLDEIADSTPTVQSALQRLLLDRKLGSLTLAKGWHTTASSNRQSDKAAAGRISTALLNRCIVVTVEPDTDVFIEWGFDNNIHPMVPAFCRWRKTPWTFDPTAKSANPAFCSPRSLHILSDILYAEPNPDYEIITGTIGDATGSEFSGFLRIWEQLPDLDKLLREADTYPVPRTMDVAIATLYALMARATEKNMGQVLKYFTRNEIELACVGIKDLLAKDKMIATLPTMQKWMADPRNVRLLTGV